MKAQVVLRKCLKDKSMATVICEKSRNKVELYPQGIVFLFS